MLFNHWNKKYFICYNRLIIYDETILSGPILQGKFKERFLFEFIIS